LLLVTLGKRYDVSDTIITKILTEFLQIACIYADFYEFMQHVTHVILKILWLYLEKAFCRAHLLLHMK